MKKIEKAKQIEMEKLEARILKVNCPHHYGMVDRSKSSNYMCGGNDCKVCWNEEIENDEA